MMAVSAQKITPEVSWDEFVALPDDDRRELIDGVLLEIDVPTNMHEWIVSALVRHLGNWAMQHKAGVVLTSGYKVKINERRGVMPDVQLFRHGPIPKQALDKGAPDLAVEVISPSSGRYDRVEKLNWYAAIGVREYWLLDPEQQTLERFVLDNGSYRVATTLGGDAVFSPDTFPGFTLNLSELWTLPEWFVG